MDAARRGRATAARRGVIYIITRSGRQWARVHAPVSTQIKKTLRMAPKISMRWKPNVAVDVGLRSASHTAKSEIANDATSDSRCAALRVGMRAGVRRDENAMPEHRASAARSCRT